MPDTTTTDTTTASTASVSEAPGLPARVALRDLPALLERHGTVTVLVTDFGDPCGCTKIPRTVQAAYRHDTPDGRGGWTSERWQLVFTGPYAYPLMLISYGDAHEFETTDREPREEDSGPCQGCRDHAASLARDAATASATPNTSVDGV